MPFNKNNVPPPLILRPARNLVNGEMPLTAAQPWR